MTDPDRELYRRTILDCVAVADTMEPTQALRPICLAVAELLARELRGAAGAQRHLHAV